MQQASDWIHEEIKKIVKNIVYEIISRKQNFFQIFVSFTACALSLD